MPKYKDGFYWMKNDSCIDDKPVYRVVEIFNILKPTPWGQRQQWLSVGTYIQLPGHDTLDNIDYYLDRKDGLWANVEFTYIERPDERK